MKWSQGAILFVAMSACVGLGAAISPNEPKPPAVIRARSFELVDEDGRKRGLWSSAEGRPGLVLYSEDGKARAILMVSKNEATLRLADSGGQKRADFRVYEDGIAFLTLFGSKGNPAIDLRSTPTGFYELAMRGDDGKTRFAIKQDNDDATRMIVSQGGKVAWEWTPPQSPVDRSKDAAPATKPEN